MLGFIAVPPKLIVRDSHLEGVGRNQLKGLPDAIGEGVIAFFSAED